MRTSHVGEVKYQRSVGISALFTEASELSNILRVPPL